MNDQEIQEWTEELHNIRSNRRDKIQAILAKKVTDYSIEDFIELCMKSLSQVADEWWVRELSSIKKSVPKNITLEQSRLRTELDALVEFEIAALFEDLEWTKEQTHWEHENVSDEWPKLLKDGEELKSSIQIKITALTNEFKKDNSMVGNDGPAPSFAPLKPRAYASSSSGSNKGGYWGMLFLGLILGGISSLYFFQASKKIEKIYENQILKLQIEKKDLEDSFSLYQQNFSRLAEGKQKNIPELESAMDPIRGLYAEKRRKAERSFSEEKIKLSRKVMSREDAERQTQQLEVRKNAALDRLSKKEEEDLKPLQKQISVLKEYMGRQ